MKLIGIEEHFLTDEIHRTWNAIGLEAVDPSMAFHYGTFEVRLLDLAEDRLAPAVFGASSFGCRAGYAPGRVVQDPPGRSRS